MPAPELRTGRLLLRGWSTGDRDVFAELNTDPVVEVGWRLKRSAWGHGYASEAARAVLALGFEEFGLREIVSFTTLGNVRSQAVMQRIGMTRLVAYYLSAKERSEQVGR